MPSIRARKNKTKMKSGLRCRISSLWILVLLTSAFASQGDVLVMKDGARVQTEGPWELRGRQVVFKLPNGALSALHLSEVDIESSDAATRAAKARPERAPSASPARRDPMLTITNESLGLDPEGGDAQDDSEESLAGGSGTQGIVSSQGDVQLVDWSYDPAGENPVYEVTGVIENRGQFVAEDVSVYLDIVAVDEETGAQDSDRHILRRARVQSTSLPPGATTDFRYGITVDDLNNYGENGFGNPVVSFDVQFRKGEVPAEDEDGVDGQVSSEGSGVGLDSEGSSSGTNIDDSAGSDDPTDEDDDVDTDSDDDLDNDTGTLF